ncbi:MAG TPA: hypothetical protein VLZ75_02840 [Chitinophagales bacterium]|nr:hypothetical protein [Chitinophagales bacterium]
MRLKKSIFFWSIVSLFASGCLFFTSCKKDKINQSSSVQLNFLTDTLTFDTVFVSLGSTTKSFTVRNTDRSAVEISKIYLKNGANSPFRLTIDGDPVNSAQNVIIPAKDSIYIFVEVTVDPNSDTLPFIMLDEVVFETNGNQQQVVLQAYGQNAHFYNGESIETETWTNDLPYVILNSLEVTKGHTLTIQEGVTVYFGGNSGMVVNGNLQIQGGQDSARWVTFRGYRLDQQVTGIPYDNLPGQWLGLFLMRESGVHKIENFRLRGSQFGINVGNTTLEELNTISINNAPQLNITNAEIYNNSVYGLYGFLAKIKATNVLIHDIGRNAFTGVLGGEYEVNHCTFYLRPSSFFDHKQPTVYLSDYHIYNTESPAIVAELKAVFTNTVVAGAAEEELIFDPMDVQRVTSTIENCALKTKEGIPSYITSNNNLFNLDFGFENPLKADFHLKETSVLIGKGKDIQVLYDIEGKSRKSPPDIGVYEF